MRGRWPRLDIPETADRAPAAGPLFGGGGGQIATLTFIGASLLIAAVRGDGGCEVMSIPGVFGGRPRLPCILFSPIDWLERRLAGVGRAAHILPWGWDEVRSRRPGRRDHRRDRFRRGEP